LITVRGTAFWVSVTSDGITRIIVEEGRVEVTGLLPGWEPGESIILEAGQSVTVPLGGEIGPVSENATPPAYPADADLVSQSCGDLRCGAGEMCAADCVKPPHCGDGICQPDDGESPLTCETDCVSGGEHPSNLHFLWGNMSCVFTPAPTLTSPISFQWGIGCFDTAASASEHPHPADYQLIIDGQAWNMGGLLQSGPHRHPPFCPWGWSYYMEPVDLEPGEHTLTLIETSTDTWKDESGGHTAGDTNRMDCHVTVIR
jgi:hypothetical protein